MKVFLEELAQPFLVRIIESDKEVIKDRIDQIWNSKKDSIVMDGFRKGKVPQDLVEKKSGFHSLYKEYIDDLVTNAINQVNAENNVTVVDIQQIVPEQLGKEGIVLQAVAYLKPNVIELDYSNLEVEKYDSSATTEEVTAQISSLQNQNALLKPIEDRGVEFGDTVVVTYVGSVNGVPFKGGAATRQQIELNTNSFIPGFGEALLGMKTNETKTFSVTFPADYRATELAGKETTFDVTVHEVKLKILPELNDDFAATQGHQSYEVLKTFVVESIEKRKNELNKSKTETAICLELVRRAKVSPIPNTMIQRRLKMLLDQELGMTGMTEEQYLKQRNITREAFDRSYYQIAMRDLKIQIILDFVANKENTNVSEEEKTEYVKTEAERLGFTLEQINNMVTEEQIVSQVRMRKSYNYLLTNAKYVELGKE